MLTYYLCSCTTRWIWYRTTTNGPLGTWWCIVDTLCEFIYLWEAEIGKMYDTFVVYILKIGNKFPGNESNRGRKWTVWQSLKHAVQKNISPQQTSLFLLGQNRFYCVGKLFNIPVRFYYNNFFSVYHTGSQINSHTICTFIVHFPF